MSKEEITKYNKIISGFVSQHFVKKGDKFTCEFQDFITGDEVDREDKYGSSIDCKINSRDEEYQQFNMVQPGYDYYYIFVWKCVDAQLIGPFNTEDERENNKEEMKHKEGEDEHIYISFKIAKEAEIEF